MNDAGAEEKRMNMTFEEFVEKIQIQAHEELGYPLESMVFYPEGYTSDDPLEAQLIKDSNLKYEGKDDTKLLIDLLIMEVSSTGSHGKMNRIGIRRLYEYSEKNGYDAAFAEIRNQKKDMDAATFDEERLDTRSKADYEMIRCQLILRPLNYDLHSRELKNCVYRKIGDVALVLYQLLGDAERSFVTSKIHLEELTLWGMDGQQEQVIRTALENTARLYPACVYDRRTGKEENFLEKEFTREDISFLKDRIILSTFRTTNGAAALFYPGVIEKMMRIMGGPFVAVFMNINDVMIFDRNDEIALQFAAMAKESGEMGEMLSGQPYLCDGKQVIPGTVIRVGGDNRWENPL